jgi:hypothetical protein
MAILTLLVIGLFCLIFRSTRILGVIGLTLISLVFPFVFLTLLLVFLVIAYFKFRRKLNVYHPPKLP